MAQDGTLAVALFFDADLESEQHRLYAVRPLATIFDALLGSANVPEYFIRVLTGDFLLRNLAYRMTGVRIKDDKYRSTGYTSSGDMDAYAALVWDFTDSVSAGWCSVDPSTLPVAIGQRRIFVVSLSAIQEADLIRVDRAATALDAYMGAVEIDGGNPLHTRVLVDKLPENYVFLGGDLGVRVWDPTDLWDLKGGDDWWTEVPFSDVFWWMSFLGETPDDYTGREPEPFPDLPLSPRGEISNRLLEAIEKKTHVERVLGDLFASAMSRPRDHHFPASIEGPWPEDLEGLVDSLEPKFTGYLLNEDHPTGKEKARVFKSALGFTSENWRLLARQVVAALSGAEPHRVRSEQHAVKYEFTTLVVGPNGREAPVQTAWRLTAQGMPFLVTAYVLSPRRVLTPPVATVPAYIVTGVRDRDFWRRLHEAAHRAGSAAMERHVPSPMFLGGPDPARTSAVAEGEFGSAWVTVRDARKGFARFLLTEEHAEPGEPSGAAVVAPSRFIQASVAYAEAYALVLRLNGVECIVSSRLD